MPDKQAKFGRREQRPQSRVPSMRAYERHCQRVERQFVVRELATSKKLMNATTTASQTARMTSGTVREITYLKICRPKILSQKRC